MSGPERLSEEYVASLERRIADQRKHILSLRALRDEGGNRSDRKRIGHLERALGLAALRLDLQRQAIYYLSEKIAAPGVPASSKTAEPNRTASGSSEASPEGNDGVAGAA